MILTGGPKFRQTLYKEIIECPDPYGIRSCGPIDTVVDLGANCGMFSLLARFVHPSARIVGVEPDPDNFAALKANVEHLRIEIYRAAVGNGIPARLMNAGTSPGSLQYIPSDEGAVPSFRLPELWHSWQCHGRIFLKIDVEGAERYFVGDSEAESCIAACHAVGAEIHAGSKYGSPYSMDDYSRWLQSRFADAHEIVLEPHYKAPRRLAQLRMKRKS